MEETQEQTQPVAAPVQTQPQVSPSEHSQAETMEPLAGIVPVTVKNSRGPGTRQLWRDKRTGKLVKNVRTDPVLSGEQHTRRMREFLTTPKHKRKQIPDAEKTPEQLINESMLELATKPTEKTAVAAVQAAKFLHETAYGKPGMSDEELSAFEKHGVKVVIVPMPDNMIHPEILDYENRPKPPLKPAFLDAEVISTNPAPTKEKSDS